MARKKTTHKIGPLQRRKDIITIVRKLKKNGIFSKNTKLHGGKWVSYRVIAKANKFQHAAALNYKAVAPPKGSLQKYIDEGYEVVGRKVIVPPSRVKAVKKAVLTGVKPVRGGYLETVVLPHDIYEIRQLYNQAKMGELDKLKLPDERFAFRFYGHLSYQTFQNTNQLLKYLSHYRSIFDAAGDLRAENMDETFKNLQFYRLAAGDANMIINMEPRIRQKRHKTVQDRSEKSYYYKRLEKMPPDRARRELARNNKKAKERRDALQSDPVKLEAYREKARARARKSYQNRKKK